MTEIREQEGIKKKQQSLFTIPCVAFTIHKQTNSLFKLIQMKYERKKENIYIKVISQMIKLNLKIIYYYRIRSINNLKCVYSARIE